MTAFAFQMPGGWEWLALLILGLLLFGKRLPEVGRSLGRSITEFKRGVQGMQEEMEREASKPATSPSAPESLPDAGPAGAGESTSHAESEKV